MPRNPEESCALDVADRGGTTLEEVGGLLGLTRERVRQIEATALQKLRKAGASRGADRNTLVDFTVGRVRLTMLEGLKERSDASAKRARERLSAMDIDDDTDKYKSVRATLRNAELESRSLEYEISKVVL